MITNDEFLSIILEHLKRDDSPSQHDYELLHDVVAEFICVLMLKGNIPHFLLDTLEDDLKEEGREIYRKLTYGFQSLRQYRIHRGILSDSDKD